MPSPKKMMLGLLALAGTMFLAMPARASMLSGFESGDAWTANPATTLSYPTLLASSPSNVAPVQGSNFLFLTYTAAAKPIISLARAGFSGSFSTSGDLSGNNILSLSYTTLDPLASQYSLELSLTDSLAVTELMVGSSKIVPVSATVTAGTSADWHSIAVSLNYLANLGLAVNSISQVSIFGFNFSSPALVGGGIHLAYDRLALDETPSTSAPNTPAGKVSSSINCGSEIDLTMPSATQNGDHPVEGFHIYRAPDNSGTYGTFTSLAYVPVATTSYADSGLTSGNSYWYIALPYDRVCPALASSSGILLASSTDPALGSLPSPFTGPNEALLSAYVAADAVKIQAQLPASINAPTGLTANACSLPEIDLVWTAATLSGTSPCNAIISYTVLKSASSSFTVSTTADVTGVSYTENSGNAGAIGLSAGTTYYYKVRANDNISELGPYGSAIAITVPPSGGTCGPPPTPPTPTASPTVSPMVPPPPPGKAEIFPNPFHPDQGQCFKVGNVANNTDLKIYDMVGSLVYSSTIPISGSTCPGGWDGLNNNGNKVVTGLYHLVLTPPGGTATIYHVAVIRGN